jgi:hypothetical protein
MPPIYNTNTGWTPGTDNDFFAIKGDGTLLLDSSFGTIRGALRKYDMENAIHMSIPEARINAGVIVNDSIDISFSTISGLATSNVLDLGQIQYAYKDFVKECADYFGVTITNWNSTSEDGLKMLFDTSIVSKIVGNTDNSASSDDDKRRMTPAGFMNIMANTTAATAALPTNKLTISQLTKNWNNAKETNAFNNSTNSNRLGQFCDGDLIFFERGVSLSFTVNLIDVTLTSGLPTTLEGGPDYINSTVPATTGNSSIFMSQTYTNHGYFSATTTLVDNALKKVYVAPLLLKVIV